jgi:acyl-CoA thioester hydrolase
VPSYVLGISYLTRNVAAATAQVKTCSLMRLASAARNPPHSRMTEILDAPFVSSVMRVEPGWIDYNGHLNMAYYNVLFDRAVDEVYEVLGLGLDYVKTTQRSTFTAEVHVRYLRELLVDAPVRVTFRLLAFDLKRMHYFEELFHAEEGWLSATSENMALNVDMTMKKTAPFPDGVMARLAQMKAAHDRLPLPDGAGRRIRMPSGN